MAIDKNIDNGNFSSFNRYTTCSLGDMAGRPWFNHCRPACRDSVQCAMASSHCPALMQD